MKARASRVKKIVVMAFVLLLASQAKAEPYSDPQGFSLNPPKEWKNVGPKGGASVAFLAPGGAHANMLVMIEPIAAGQTLDSVAKNTLHDMQPREPKLISQTTTKVSGLPACKLIYTVKNGEELLELYQLFVSKGGKLYEFQGTCSQATYSQYGPIFEACAASLKIQ